MNILANPKKLRGFEQNIKVDNVSRRSILKGLGVAGGFVLAAPVMSRPSLAAYQTGADKMPHGTIVDPRVFVAIAPDGKSARPHRTGKDAAPDDPARQFSGSDSLKASLLALARARRPPH